MVPTMICLLTLAVSIQKCGIHRAAVCRTMITPNGMQRKKMCPKRKKGRDYKKKLSTVSKAVETVPAKSHEIFSFLLFFLSSFVLPLLTPSLPLSFLSFLPSSFYLDYTFALKQNCFIKNQTFPFSIVLLLDKIYLKRELSFTSFTLSLMWHLYLAPNSFLVTALVVVKA